MTNSTPDPTHRTARTRRLWIAVAAIALASAPLAAAERADRTLALEGDIDDGGFLRVENLLGSITVEGASDDGKWRVEARIVAEGDSREIADGLAEGFTLERDADDETVVRVGFPTDRYTSFRMPRSEAEGIVSKVSSFVTPFVKKKSVALEYDGAKVEVGNLRGATPAAVHVRVWLPLDTVVELDQAVGSLVVARLRGTTSLAIDEGQVVAMQMYGDLAIRTGGGHVEIKSFRGDRLRVQTGQGTVSLVDVHADAVELRSSSGAIEGHTIQAASLAVDSDTGDVVFEGVEPSAFEVRSGSGEIDLATRLRRTTQASIESGTGDVTLRVGDVTPFDLEATTGSVKTKGVKRVDVVERTDGLTRLRRGSGGVDLRIVAGGDFVLRPI